LIIGHSTRVKGSIRGLLLLGLDVVDHAGKPLSCLDSTGCKSSEVGYSSRSVCGRRGVVLGNGGLRVLGLSGVVWGIHDVGKGVDVKGGDGDEVGVCDFNIWGETEIYVNPCQEMVSRVEG
jgi:hypothetical protein